MAERHHSFRPQPDEHLAPSHAEVVEVPVEAPAPVVVPDPIPEPVPVPVPVPVVVPDAQTVPSAQVVPAPAAPSLSTAFTVLCQAIDGHLTENQTLSGHCDEIQAWHANAGGDEQHENSIMAWRHAVQLLEGVLGHRLTLG